MGSYRSKEFNQRVLRLSHLYNQPTWSQICAQGEKELPFNEHKYLITQTRKFHLERSPYYTRKCSKVITRTRHLDSSIKVRLAFAHICHLVEKMKHIIIELAIFNDIQVQDQRLQEAHKCVIKSHVNYQRRIEDEDIEDGGTIIHTAEVHRYIHRVKKPNRSKPRSINSVYTTTAYPLINSPFVESPKSYISFLSMDSEQPPLKALNIATNLAYHYQRFHKRKGTKYNRIGPLTVPYKISHNEDSTPIFILNVPSFNQRQSSHMLGFDGPIETWGEEFDEESIMRHLLGSKPTNKVMNDDDFISFDEFDKPLIVLADPSVHPIVIQSLKDKWCESPWAKELGQRNGILTTVLYEDQPVAHFKLAPRTGRIISIWERKS
jgi:hypothetical protein